MLFGRRQPPHAFFDWSERHAHGQLEALVGLHEACRDQEGNRRRVREDAFAECLVGLIEHAVLGLRWMLADVREDLVYSFRGRRREVSDRRPHNRRLVRDFLFARFPRRW